MYICYLLFFVLRLRALRFAVACPSARIWRLYSPQPRDEEKQVAKGGKVPMKPLFPMMLLRIIPLHFVRRAWMCGVSYRPSSGCIRIFHLHPLYTLSNRPQSPMNSGFQGLGCRVYKELCFFLYGEEADLFTLSSFCISAMPPDNSSRHSSAGRLSRSRGAGSRWNASIRNPGCCLSRPDIYHSKGFSG